MNNIKIITLFHTNKKIPFMTCIVKDVEENEQGIKLTLESGDNIHVKDYGYSSYQNQQISLIRNE